MNFPRREEATNKELILTIIEIQGYLARYGRTHTNWHETLNEVIERLEEKPDDAEDCADKRMTREEAIAKLKNFADHCYPNEEFLMAIKALSAEQKKMSFGGMTNGEVIDLLFPGADIYHNRDFTLREMIFPDEWWNAPYKAEGSEKE